MKRKSPRRGRVAVVLGVAVGLVPAVGTTATTVSAGVSANQGSPLPSWLETLNAYRQSSGLPSVANDASLQAGVDLHARYLTATGSASHTEDPANPRYSPSGALAASQSVLGAWGGKQRNDREVIEDWLGAPFHGIHLLEPRLLRSAFGVQRDQLGSPFESAGVLNVTAGIGPKVTFDAPIVFPGRDRDGSADPLPDRNTEPTDPLPRLRSACGASASRAVPERPGGHDGGRSVQRGHCRKLRHRLVVSQSVDERAGRRAVVADAEERGDCAPA